MDGNVEIKTAEIPVNEYMSAFRDVSTFSECCRRCGNYGNLWSCPPFGFDSEACLSRWTTAFVVAARSEVPSGLLHKEMMDMFLRPLRKKLEKRMLELESRYGGLAFGFSGECRLCSDCARHIGEPCRHPDLVRPALEAFGFDIGKTVRELFGYELQWDNGGDSPWRLTLVGALFHDRMPGEISFM